MPEFLNCVNARTLSYEYRSSTRGPLCRGPYWHPGHFVRRRAFGQSNSDAKPRDGRIDIRYRYRADISRPRTIRRTAPGARRGARYAHDGASVACVSLPAPGTRTASLGPMLPTLAGGRLALHVCYTHSINYFVSEICTILSAC